MSGWISRWCGFPRSRDQAELADIGPEREQRQRTSSDRIQQLESQLAAAEAAAVREREERERAEAAAVREREEKERAEAAAVREWEEKERAVREREDLASRLAEVAAETAVAAANLERVQKDAAEAAAEAQTKRADEAESWPNWATFSALKVGRKPFEAAKLHPEPSHDLPDLFKHVVSDDKNGTEPKESAGRSSPGPTFLTDLLGNKRLPIHERAHLIPESDECRKHWIPVIKWMCGRCEISDKQARMLLYGFTEDSKMENHSNITCRMWNYVAMAQQGYVFDTDPLVMLLPDLDWDLQLQWNGEEYGCYVFGRKAEVYGWIDAEREAGSHMKSVTKEGVPKVLATFSQALVALSAALCHKECPTVVEKKCCGPLREQLAKLSTLPVPELDPNQVGELQFLRVSFGPCEELLKGGAAARQREGAAHPAPHPVLLSARACNAWFNYLYQEHRNQIWEADAAAPTHFAAAVLLPSCRDLCDIPDCDLCRKIISRSDDGWMLNVEATDRRQTSDLI